MFPRSSTTRSKNTIRIPAPFSATPWRPDPGSTYRTASPSRRRRRRNVISGNSYSGILVTDSGTNNTVIAGNYVGLKADGAAAILDIGQDYSKPGIVVQWGAANTRIGTNGDGLGDVAEGNVVSGNPSTGIVVWGTGADNTVIAGNIVGLNAAGNARVPNIAVGINIGGGAKTPASAPTATA